MDLPGYFIIISDLNGDVIQCPTEFEVKTIFDIVNIQSLSLFKEEIKRIIDSGDYLKLIKIKLANGSDYYLTLECYDTSKICFNFKMCRDADKFWTDTLVKHEYYLNRERSIITSVSNVIENLFYKNRSDINGILIDFCNSLKIQSALLLFHNGIDHFIYCKDTIQGYNCDYLPAEKEGIKFNDSEFDENVIKKIDVNLHVKKYSTTYFQKLLGDNLDRDVYILKLMFGPKLIGFLELIPHTYVQLIQTEIDFIQSLSSVLAYVINNRLEQIEVEKYIKNKLSLNSNTTQTNSKV